FIGNIGRPLVMTSGCTIFCSRQVGPGTVFDKDILGGRKSIRCPHGKHVVYSAISHEMKIIKSNVLRTVKTNKGVSFFIAFQHGEIYIFSTCERQSMFRMTYPLKSKSFFYISP